MTKRTVLEKDGDLVIVTTDGHGTQVTDGDGKVIVTYGDDRHDEVVADYVSDGWNVSRG